MRTIYGGKQLLVITATLWLLAVSEQSQGYQVIIRDQQAVQVNVVVVTGDGVAVEFATPNENQPNSFNNTLILWEVDDNEVPWSRSDEGTAVVLGDEPDSSMFLGNVSITVQSFLVGYAVGPLTPGLKWSSYANVVATSFIPTYGTSNLTFPSSSSLNISQVNPDSLTFSYQFLSGFEPGPSGAWVGLFEGLIAPYNIPPRWFVAIGGRESEGTAVLQHLALEATDYSLALYATGFSPFLKSLNLHTQAAFVSFSLK